MFLNFRPLTRRSIFCLYGSSSLTVILRFFKQDLRVINKRVCPKTDCGLKLSDGKRMNIWTAVRTALEKNPGMRSKHLIEELEKKTGLSRSTIFEHLSSFEVKREICREIGRYYLPDQWKAFSNSQSRKHYNFPNVSFEVTQRLIDVENKRYLPPNFQRPFPSVGFNMWNLNDYPVRVRVRVRMILGGRDKGLIPDPKGYYNGETEMLFGPKPDGLENGNFSVLKECEESDEELTLQVSVLVIDPDGVEHRLSPKSWTYMRKENSWSYEPRVFVEEQWPNLRLR